MRTRVIVLAGVLGAAFAASNAGAAELIINGGFESPALSSGYNFGPDALQPASNYVYPGYSAPQTVDGWTYSGGVGLIDTSQGSNAWYGSTSPSGYGGNQYAFVQGQSTLLETFTSTSAGSATLSWLDAGRPDFGSYGGDQTYEVIFNNALVGTFSTLSGQNFTPEMLSVLLLAGSNTLEFVGQSASDNTAFIDNVSISVPELSTWVLLSTGFAALAFAGHRARRPAGALV